MSLRYDVSSGQLVHAAAGSVTVMMPWPVMKAFRRGRTGYAWSQCQPAFALPPVARGDCEALSAARNADDDGLADLQAFCRRIPTPVREAVSEFPERHWELLSWAARSGPTADDLFRSNPAVAFAIACGAELVVDHDPVRFGQKQFLMAYHSQRDVLARLGFPPTERVRRILRKVPVGNVTLVRLRQLRQSLADETVAERLAHVPIVSAAVIQVLADGTIGLVTPAVLNDIARSDLASPAVHGNADETARRLAEVMACWNLVRPTQPLRPIQRVERLHRIHEEVQADVHKVRHARRGVFPNPPFPGDDRIVPITSPAMLVEESRLQRNCARDYSARCESGALAFYRVLFPERCTLSLKRGARGWSVGQLKTACNGQASTGTWRFVREWLARAQERPDRNP